MAVPWEKPTEPMPAPSLLADPIGFWEQRHASFDAWRSGGDRGLSPEENYEFYAIRLGRILELLRRHAGGERGLRILDAGCGRGHVTDALRRCGHNAVGIDSSPTAVALANEQYGPHFRCHPLDQMRPGALFDVVVCLDVLFHVLDDDAWRKRLENNAAKAPEWTPPLTEPAATDAAKKK